MKILVTQRHVENEHGDWTDSLENAYIKTFEELGFQLTTVSNVSEGIDSILNGNEIGGMLLTGGGDVGSGNEEVIVPNVRDVLEYKLLDHAVEHHIPVLGICRGMQSINVYFKGKLFRDITSIDTELLHSTPSRHSVKLSNPEVIAAVDGMDEVEVNSYHDHAVVLDGLGDNLASFAEFEPLHLVEGLFHKQNPIAGIQWHPEREKSLAKIDSFLIESFKNRSLFWK